MINIGLLGLGTVGTGIVEILNNRKDELKRIIGQEINIKKILVKNLNKEREVKLDEGILTNDFNEILNDKEISIIIEVTGDLGRSYEYITEALNSGKNVVTANKAVVSKYFEELSALAREKNLAFLYEASVGGGIPVIKPLKEQLAFNEISEVQGILNGTCNYILTRMIDEGKDYDEVLKIAQELGYAEADPTADVEGHDTLRKLRILATLSLQGRVTEEDIILNGISSITSFDINHIKNMDSTVKLIGEARAYEDGFTAVVQPVIVKNNNYFANVNMAFNSVAFKGNNVGELKFYGAGAGKLVTANAVLSDVLDVILASYRKGNPLGQNKLKNNNDKIKGSYYLRISASNEDIASALRDISSKVLSEGSTTAIITEEIEISKINKLISSFEIDKKDYFLARILL
ncbi:MAG: homoserine dehydrogenase [Clostridiales bacterium]|nr:homoserine dehydrogenase [Clostridiales bacterium]